MEAQKSPIDVFLNVVAQKLIDAGIGLTMHEIQLLLHPHKKAIAHAAAPITEDVVATLSTDGGGLPPDPTHPKP